MDLKSNIHTSFPFYDTNYLPLCNDSLNGWHFWKQWMPGRLASFQIRRTTGVGNSITGFYLKNFAGVTVQSLSTANLDTVTLTGVDYIVYDGLTNNISLSDGSYYIEVTDGTTTWRSVRFMVDSTADLLKFTYYNSTDIGYILYNKTPQNKCELWLPVDLCDTDNEFEETGAKRGTLFIARKKSLNHRYTMTFKAPEYIVNAFSYMWLHDNITVTRPNGESSEVFDLEVDSDRLITCVADLTVIFRINTIEKTGCTANMT